jgi:hypothetical protein
MDKNAEQKKKKENEIGEEKRKRERAKTQHKSKNISKKNGKGDKKRAKRERGPIVPRPPETENGGLIVCVQIACCSICRRNQHDRKKKLLVGLSS